MGRKQEMVVTGETGVTTEVREWRPPAAAGRDMVPGVGQLLPAYHLIETWPVQDLVPHPDNPRTVNLTSPRFQELQASIAANGIYEPLTVRELPDEHVGTLRRTTAQGREVRQILSGHRRWTAAMKAGLAAVPVRNLGLLPEDAAYDIVAMGNLHEDLTPLEEGKRAALWLDKYHGDVAAVASKLGRTPSWVAQHAQIARGLSAEWQKEIAEAVDHEERPKWRQWTAGHLAVIARLPVALQAYWLEKTRKDYRFASWPDDTIKSIEDDVKLDLLYLAKAPFNTEVMCPACTKRTDRAPLLWGETVEAATGDQARCLDRKCWDAQCRAAARERFKQEAAKLNEKVHLATPAVPLSLREEPKDYYKREDYRREMSALKKAFPRLVTADQVTVVTEKTKGAVPAIVVAGKGKNSVRWVKIQEKKESARGGRTASRPPTAAELAQQKERQAEDARWSEVLDRFGAHMQKLAVPPADMVLFLLLFVEAAPPWGKEWDKLVKTALQAKQKRPDQPVRVVLEYWWKEIVNNGHLWFEAGDERGNVRLLGPLFGFDTGAVYKEIKAAEVAPESAVPANDGCPVEAGTGECVSDGNCEECPRGKGRKQPKAKRGRRKKAVAATEETVARDVPDGDLAEDEDAGEDLEDEEV